MKQYHNYSPEILTGEDITEPDITDQPSPQPTPAPGRQRSGRQRRPAVANDPGATQNNRKREPQAKTASKENPKDNKVSVAGAFRQWKDSTVTRSIFGIILGGLGLWFAVAFVSYFSSCVIDQSMVADTPVGSASAVGNDAGEGGARLTELLINQGFGVGSVVIVVWLICMSLKLLVGYPRFRTLDFTIKSLIAFITISVVVGMLTIGLDTDVNWGGMHGRFINEIIYSFIGWSGAIIISVVLVSLFVVICLRDVVKWIMRKKRAYDERRRLRREAAEEELRKEEELEALKRQELQEQSMLGEDEQDLELKIDANRIVPDNVEFDPEADTIFDLPELEEDDDMEDIATEAIDDPDSLANTEEPIDENEFIPGVEPLESVKTVDPMNSLESSDSLPLSAETEAPVTDQVENETRDVMTVDVNQIEKGSDDSGVSYDTELFTHEYKFPPMDYLRPGSDKISVDVDEQKENKEKIQSTLLDFGIPITSIKATVGPTVTLYEIRPDNGVKIAKIRNLADDLALALAAKGVRIIAPIPGKGTVGIEVANKDAQTVSMRTIIQSAVYQNSRYKLPVALGSTISNEVYIADLAKMPHLLVAGATGQGKSVGLNAIITSLLYSKRPEELKFVMVDPKRVEFALYSKIEKYYLAKIPDSPQPIITNMENVVATLSSLCVEMDERYKLLEKAYVRQVTEYNEKFKERKLDPREGHRFMPYIVVIIDEFADLIMTAGKEVELPIARLAQLARAVGIHVIIATQRPSTNVITGMIKANFPVRIAFKVSSGVDSKTILDSTGAQQLIGRGDMLISNNGEMTRVQCAFVDTPEVEEVCDYIARQPYPQGPYILPEPQMGGDGDAQDMDPAAMGKKDPLLEEVARQVVMSGTASTSAVQRRYEIGYNRAGRIMDQLEILGVVGPATGGKPRNVLVDMMSLEDILSSLN